MENNNYTSYQSMVSTVISGATQLEGVCGHLEMQNQSEELRKISDRLQNHVFSVGIMGEFKRGKSTVINAMLGSSVVPADIMPCSATLNYIKWDTVRHAQVRFKNGTVKDVAVEELSDYITKITEESERTSKEVEDAIVYYPCRFCQNGVQIIDTPGLNDDERMNTISESVIPRLDAIIMVTVPGSPFGISEAEFVRNKVMTSDLGRIIFVINKIDTVDEDDRERIISHIKRKIEASVLEKMKAVYGEESEEYSNAREKLAGIRVIGVSAKQALKSRLTGNGALLEQSGFSEFEQGLSKLLVEERGILELIRPINQMIAVAKESIRTIETRMNALCLDAEEFKIIQTQSMEKIEETREKKKAEIKLLKAKGKTLYVDLLPDVRAAYDEVGESIQTYISGLAIPEKCLTEQAAMDEFAAGINAVISDKFTEIITVATERLANKVNGRLGKDVKELEVFGEEFCQTIEQIHLEISADGGKISGDFGRAAKDTLLDVGGIIGTALLFEAGVPGIGAIISGWREYGLKGAVVGGISGAGIGIASAFLVGSIGLVGLPVLLIVGAASTFGGRAITNLFFGRGRKARQNVTPESIRNGMLHSVAEATKALADEQTLEKWLKKYCEDAYSMVAEDVDQEWENTLISLEENLSKIKSDLQLRDAEKQEVEAHMKEYAEILKKMLVTINPIKEKLSAALGEI